MEIQDISLFSAHRSASVRHWWSCQQPGCYWRNIFRCTLSNYK